MLIIMCVGFAVPAAASGTAPIAENLELNTFRNTSVYGALSAYDPEGDVISFEITTKPVKGEIKLEENGTFVYTPVEGKKGRDYFGYKALDSEGNFSQEATVIIKIAKQNKTMEYADNSSAHLETLQNELYGNEVKRVRFTVFSRIFLALAFQAGHATAFLWGVWGISTGVVTYGMMTAFLQLVGQIQRPLAEMTNRIPSIIHATASIDRLDEIEALPTEYVEEPVFLDGPLGIRLADVDFSYPEVQVLKDFSHDFIPGSRTAVVGPTGVGKTTLIRLLLSLLKPSKGSVSIYSSASSVLVSSSTRCNLVYVPQGNSLFSGTIRENLHIGDPDATDEQMIHALHTAAADFVFDLPSGLDTQCFEAGAGLSEGQAQRIAVARALLRPGSILLLDEFSSALDADTENLLMERLTASLPSHTMIFITHREKIIDYCDSILRL